MLQLRADITELQDHAFNSPSCLKKKKKSYYWWGRKEKVWDWLHVSSLVKMTLTQMSSYQHTLVADPCVRGLQQCAAAKNSSSSFSQTRYFTLVSDLVNLIQTCVWQGQTQYTDVTKTILSFMCKMNQFFAVSSHTPLPGTATVINLYEIHTASFSRLCWAWTLPVCDRTSATNHSWSRKLEVMKTHRNITPQVMK